MATVESVTSGKQSKRRRAAAPTAPPAVGRKGQRRQASPRVLLAAASVLVLVAVAVVLGFAFSGGSSKAHSKTVGSLANGLPGAAEVQRLLKGIPQQGNVLGSASAPVTMVEYVDLQCPFCQQFETQAMTKLIPRYVRTGKVKVELKTIAFIGPDSMRGRAAVLAAGQQNKLFNVAQLLYVNQGTENSGWLSNDLIEATAASIPGLDVSRLLDERSSSSVSNLAQELDDEAKADNVRQTPTILVGKSGAALAPVALSSPTDANSVAAAISAALS
jgi:protein-disulfide isomerase